LIVGIEGLQQLATKAADFRIEGPLGNSSYLGVYALVHIFIALLFWFRNAYHIHHERTNNGIWKFDSIAQLIGYTAIAAFNAYVMYHTGTRGSFIGLACGMLFSALAIAIVERTHKVIRGVGIAIVALTLLVVVLLGSFKNSDFVKSHSLLARFSALATFDVKGVLSNEGHARTLLWGIAFDGFKQHPLLGWGQDNFGYVFAQHYNPEMYGQEVWFDRTHNVVFDWLIAAGLLGLLSYLSLFVGLIYLLWRRSSEFELYERVILTGLLIAYFVHNLFVFDNLSSYIIFFSLLAYVHTIAGKKALLPKLENSQSHAAVFDPVIVGYVCVPVIVILLGASIYFINVKSLKANFTLITSMISCRDRRYDEASAQFKKALAYGTYDGRSEIREQLLSCTTNVIGDPKASNELKGVWFNDAMAAMKAQIAETPADPRPYMITGSFLNSIGRYEESIPYLEQGLKTAPGKQQMMLLLSLDYLNLKQTDKAIALLKDAYDITPNNEQIKLAYAAGLIFAGKKAEADAIFGATSTIMTNDQVISAYQQRKEYGYVIDAYRARAARTPDDVQAAIVPGIIYFKMGDKSSAIREFRQVAIAFPKYAKEFSQIINEIQAGRDPFVQK
ncbi:MAG: hypothetical protein JWO73_274, partial [Candidatus Taylorbacteria bacterium]|nr:hypothetical protein [Candidatus Taylorbacteria bacterium]